MGVAAANVNSYFTVTSPDKNNNESDMSPGLVLPVTGLELSVQLSGNAALINWTILTEINTRF